MELEEIKMAEETKKDHNEEEVEEQETEGAESTETEGSDDKNSGGKSTGGKESGGKTFTQEQVTKMMTREKNQGRNAAYKELGIDPKDDKMVKMFKAFVDSQKTDDQKKAEQESENQTKLNEAEQRAIIAEAKAEAMMLGVKSQYVDDIVTLALAKMTDDSDLKTIIGEFKTKYPVWFGESEEDDKNDDKSKAKTGQKGTGSSVKNSDKEKKGEDDKKGLGARLAAQRKSGNKKSSYWGK
jgi:hypothetical protein